jgi:hypothetical protein
MWNDEKNGDKSIPFPYLSNQTIQYFEKYPPRTGTLSYILGFVAIVQICSISCVLAVKCLSINETPTPLSHLGKKNYAQYLLFYHLFAPSLPCFGTK